MQEYPPLVSLQWALGLAEAGSYRFAWTAVPFFVTALAIALTAAFTVYWERGSRISRLFAVFSGLFVLWSLGRGLAQLLVDPELMVPLMRLVVAVSCLAVPLLVEASLVLLRRSEPYRRLLFPLNRLLGTLLALVTAGGGAVLSGVHHYGWGMEPAAGPLLPLVVVWMSALSTLLLVNAWLALRNALPGSVESRRLRLLGLAIIALVLNVLDFAAFFGLPVYPISFAAMLIFDLLTAFITWRYGLVEVTETLAAPQIAGLSRGALLLLDGDGVIRATNERTRDLLARDDPALMGRRASQLIGEALSVTSLRRLAALADSEAEKVLLYQPPGGAPSAYLALSVAAVRDPRGRDVAYACALRQIETETASPVEPAVANSIDRLTGLPDRHTFLIQLDAAAARQRQNPASRCALLVVGLERLRRINEDLGYAAGDQVLAELSRRLRLVARSGDALARVGSDEFGVLLRGSGQPEEVSALAEELRAALDLPVQCGEQRLVVQARIGITTSEQGHDSGEELLRNGSIALFRARERGTAVHLLAAGDAVQQRLVLESELRRALHRGELRVYYQPVIDLDARRVSGFEALVRWQHPKRGLLLPGEFIEVAEDVGLLARIDLFVLRQSCADLARLRLLPGYSGLTVNVNLSEPALQAHDLFSCLDRALADAALPAKALRVELLEQVAQVGPLRSILQALRERDIDLYIDDFGSGYSALGRLHEVPARGIKIDRSLVCALAQGDGGRKVVAAIVALAGNLGLRTIAEGCGTLNEVQAVRGLGCHHAQGFYFSRARPFEELPVLLGDDGPMAAALASLETTGEC